MSDNIITTVSIDPDRDAYRDFFSTEQAQSLLKLELGAYSSLVDNLAYAWRTAAYAASLPGQIAGQIPAFLRGWHDSPSSFTSQQTSTEMVLGLLHAKLPTITADPQFLSELRTTVSGLVEEVREVRSKQPLEVTEDDLWKQFLRLPEYQFYISGSQRFCYLSAYAAYEVFLVGLVREKLQDQSIRVTDRDPKFTSRLIDAVGQSEASRSWSAAEVAMPREIRNSMLHERGRMTAKLETYREKLRLVSDEIQLHPADNRKLIRDLLSRVKRLISAVI